MQCDDRNWSRFYCKYCKYCIRNGYVTLVVSDEDKKTIRESCSEQLLNTVIEHIFLWERCSQLYKWRDAVGWLSIAVIFTSIFSRKLIRVLCSYVYSYMYVYVCICLWIYTFWIYSLSTLEKTDENRMFFVRSPHHKHFGKAQNLVLWALWWHQLFSPR